jgi:hypothetical protein
VLSQVPNDSIVLLLTEILIFDSREVLSYYYLTVLYNFQVGTSILGVTVKMPFIRKPRLRIGVTATKHKHQDIYIFVQVLPRGWQHVSRERI